MLRVLLPETRDFAEDTGQVVFTCGYFGVMCHVFQLGHNERQAGRSVACVLAWWYNGQWRISRNLKTLARLLWQPYWRRCMEENTKTQHIYVDDVMIWLLMKKHHQKMRNKLQRVVLTYFLSFLSISGYISSSEVKRRSWFWFKCASTCISHRIQYSWHHSNDPPFFFSLETKAWWRDSFPEIPSHPGKATCGNNMTSCGQLAFKPHQETGFTGHVYLANLEEKVKLFYLTCKEKTTSFMGTNCLCAQSKHISISSPKILQWVKSQSGQDLKMLTNAGFTSQFYASSDSYWVPWTIFEWETKTTSSSANSSVSVC